MGKQYFVVEVFDPNAVEPIRNEWVPIKAGTDHENTVTHQFRRLREDGVKTTGKVSRVYVDDAGELHRLELTERVKVFARDGFRTISAMLRA